MQVGHFTEEEEMIFTITPVKTRPYEYRDSVHLSISYERRLDLFRVERDVYNMLDWLGDVGGLRDALFMIGAFILFLHVLIRGN